MHALPATLDETYERMLTGIDHMFREEALVLLRWLAYARLPPTLSELAEASIVDPPGQGVVDVGNRGSLEGTLEILLGLVSCGKTEDGDQKLGKDSRVRLAHFSVKEYLESERVVQRHAKDFFLESGIGHRLLAQSCLTYIMHYSSNDEKASSSQHFWSFLLLKYAARSWYYHTSLQQSGDVSREICLLQSEDTKRSWLLVHRPEEVRKDPFDDFTNVGPGLYYASLTGLLTVIWEFLTRGVDVNAQGGYFGNALQAASREGYKKVLEILLEQGADFNARGGEYGSVLQAASEGGHQTVVEMLIGHGADVNGQGGVYGSALQAASLGGYDKVIEMLISKGALKQHTIQ